MNKRENLSSKSLSLFFAVVEQYGIETNSCAAVQQELSQATFAAEGKVLGIVFPTGKERIRSILSLAQQNGVSLYPISGGKNWGYGSCVPPNKEGVVLSLSKMNQIIDFEEDSGSITLEPGVSFEQLQAFLIGKQSKWHFNSPGSTTKASVVGNTLARGLVQGPSLERWKSAIALEVILSNGEVIQTDKTSSKGVNRSLGVGPNSMPLFFQSNLGIVTQMKLQLDRLPRHWKHLHFCWKESTISLERMTNVLKEMSVEGLLGGSISLHNAEKIQCTMQQYPWTEANGKTPLPETLKQDFITAIEGGDWYAETAIAAPNEMLLEAFQRTIEEKIKGLPLQVFWKEDREEGPIFHRSSETSGKQMYWRKRQQAPEELQPEKDKVGVRWYCPVIPLKPDHLQEVNQLVRSIATKYDFEPLLSFQIDNSNYAYVIISIFYDREIPLEDEKAQQAYKALKEQFTNKGYQAYRLGVNEQNDELDKNLLLKKIKQGINPKNTIVPNFYS